MRMGLIRNHYVGRTFIEPSQAIRDFGVKLKLNPVRNLLEGKRVKAELRVTGTVRLKLYKGNVIIAGRTTPYPLYDETLASSAVPASTAQSSAAKVLVVSESSARAARQDRLKSAMGIKKS